MGAKEHGSEVLEHWKMGACGHGNMRAWQHGRPGAWEHGGMGAGLHGVYGKMEALVPGSMAPRDQTRGARVEVFGCQTEVLAAEQLSVSFWALVDARWKLVGVSGSLEFATWRLLASSWSFSGAPHEWLGGSRRAC